MVWCAKWSIGRGCHFKLRALSKFPYPNVLTLSVIVLSLTSIRWSGFHRILIACLSGFQLGGRRRGAIAG